jgi:SAM-dependent methyltransferase
MNKQRLVEMEIPKYVADYAMAYQLEEFRAFFNRIDVHGKKILEIGSDYHSAVARLFSANGADHVVATNLGNWRCSEPLPPNVEFWVGDVGDMNSHEKSFDIVYGMAILEHIPDLHKVTAKIDSILRPGGVAYLTGWPLWTGRLGHHVVVRKEKEDFETAHAADVEDINFLNLYEFTDEKKNPIPDWAHLVFSPAELMEFLIAKNIPLQHAKRIVNFVYNVDGAMTGSCSNFKSASEILDALGQRFEVEVERVCDESKNEYFTAALAKYSEMDLRTSGLRVWLRPK